jgi:N-methylhydantoinase B/oxoprolinase/acetone carboxylase alpha subunit
VLYTDGKKIVLKSKVNLTVKPGDVLRIETPGGGGYGRPPKKR